MDGCERSGLECNVICVNSRKKMVKKKQIEFGFIAKEGCYAMVCTCPRSSASG